MLRPYQQAGIGETSAESTIYHGLETNISPSIVDHAGLMDQLVLLLTELTFSETELGPIPLFLLKALLTVKLEEAAMEVILSKSTFSDTTPVFQRKHAKLMLLKILLDSLALIFKNV